VETGVNSDFFFSAEKFEEDLFLRNIIRQQHLGDLVDHTFGAAEVELFKFFTLELVLDDKVPGALFYPSVVGFLFLAPAVYELYKETVGEFPLKFQQFLKENGLAGSPVSVHQHEAAVGFGFQYGLQDRQYGSDPASCGEGSIIPVLV